MKEMLADFEIQKLIKFTIINLIYVILNTIKSVMQIKGSKRQSCLTSAICYGFYTIVLKQVAEVSYFTSITGTMVSNVIGDYLGRTLSGYLIKRPVRSYKFTINQEYNEKIENIKEFLSEHKEKIGCHWVYAENFEKKFLKFTAYTKDKEADLLMEKKLLELDIHNKHTEDY